MPISLIQPTEPVTGPVAAPARESLDRDAIGRDVAFLAKPFTPARLARVVRDVLDGIAPEEDRDNPRIRALA